MATTTLQFANIVDDWCRAQPARMEAIWKESSQRTVSMTQANVPVDTGFLRASIRASTDSMPPIEAKARPDAGASYTSDSAYVATIAGAELGQSIFVGYTAGYAGFVEYGTSRMAPRAFVGLAVAQWPVTVSQVAAELKARAGL